MAETNIEGRGSRINGRRSGADGVSLRYREMGAGPPVVVLHGGPGAHHDYLIPGYDRLATEFHLYFYDQRGGGGSRVERPNEISWRDHVADLDALRSGWGLERLNLVGYSWGGLLALLYACEQPDRVAVLVAVDPAAAWGDYHRRFDREFRRRNDSPEVRAMREELERSDLRERDPEAYERRRFELAVAGYFRDPASARDLTPFRVQEQARRATWASLRGQAAEIRRCMTAIAAPTLILHGRHDPIPLEYARELADLLPDARLVVLERSGHVPHVEEPDRLFEEILAFLRDHVER